MNAPWAMPMPGHGALMFAATGEPYCDEPGVIVERAAHEREPGRWSQTHTDGAVFVVDRGSLAG